MNCERKNLADARGKASQQETTDENVQGACQACVRCVCVAHQIIVQVFVERHRAQEHMLHVDSGETQVRASGTLVHWQDLRTCARARAALKHKWARKVFAARHGVGREACRCTSSSKYSASSMVWLSWWEESMSCIPHCLRTRRAAHKSARTQHAIWGESWACRCHGRALVMPWRGAPSCTCTCNLDASTLHRRTRR